MIKGTPSDESVLQVLDRLSKDNDFREQFLGDPAGALKAYGIDVDTTKIPAVRKLPSREEMARLYNVAKETNDPAKVGFDIFLLT